LTFKVAGTDELQVTIELCFNERGKLSGVTDASTDNAYGNFFLGKGMGSYQIGNDSIEFGPGTFAHRNIRNLEGEQYGNYYGNLKIRVCMCISPGLPLSNTKYFFLRSF